MVYRRKIEIISGKERTDEKDDGFGPNYGDIRNNTDSDDVKHRRARAVLLNMVMLAYNLFNWFRRLVLPANMRKQQVDTIRLKLIKIAARAIHSARSITFKLCSSCPYKKEFYRTLENIQQLFVQLE